MLGLNVAIGFIPGISLVGHIAGIVVGVIVGFVYGLLIEKKSKTT